MAEAKAEVMEEIEDGRDEGEEEDATDATSVSSREVRGRGYHARGMPGGSFLLSRCRIGLGRTHMARCQPALTPYIQERAESRPSHEIPSLLGGALECLQHPLGQTGGATYGQGLWPPGQSTALAWQGLCLHTCDSSAALPLAGVK